MLSSVSYSHLMSSAEAFIEIKLDMDDPIEISDFAALFAGFGAEIERHLQSEHPELSGAARMYVKEVKKGSVVASLFAQIPDLVGLMDAGLIVLAFGALFNKRIRDFIKGKHLDGASKPQLNDLTRTLRAIAEDKNGTMNVKGFRLKEGIFSTEFEAVFTAKDARTALVSGVGGRS